MAKMTVWIFKPFQPSHFHSHLSLLTSTFPGYSYFWAYSTCFFSICQFSALALPHSIPCHWVLFPSAFPFLFLEKPTGHSDLERPFYRWNMGPSISLQNLFRLLWWSMAYDQFIGKLCYQVQYRSPRMMVYHWPLLWFLMLPWRNELCCSY